MTESTQKSIGKKMENTQTKPTLNYVLKSEAVVECWAMRGKP